MAIIQFETSSSPIIHIESHGNLHLLGEAADELIYKGGPSEAVTEEEAGAVYRIKSDTTCQVQVPVAATVIISNVHGNSQFKGVIGPITIEKIGGNLTLYQIGPATIKKIYGNLKIQDVNGDLEVHSVYGNVTAQDVSGNLQVHEKAKGNLIIRQVGSMHASALGNATLGLDPQPDRLYHVEASGNIHCSIPVEAGVELNLKSSSRQIQVNFPDQQEKINENEFSLIRNDGRARITMISKGYIHLTGMSSEGEFSPDLGLDFEGSFADVTDEISGLIDLQMAALEQQLNERLSHIPELGENAELHNDIDEIVEQARQYSTNAAFKAQEKAQRAAQRAQAKLTRKLEKARRKSQRQSSRPSWREQNRSQQWAPGRSSTTAGDPVTEEERLLILKMLEENKITLEEADQLLAALEGRKIKMPPSYETERMRILEMVEQGSITSSEAIRLLDALSGPGPSVEPPTGSVGLSPSEPGTEIPIEGFDSPVSQNDPNMDEWRRWWRFPLAIGALISLASGLLLFQAYRTLGYGFWFFCTWVPLALGLAAMSLAWFSRTARWLHIRIYQSSGEWPQRIALSFPLPIRFSAWVLRRFGKWIPILEGTSLDELLLALDENTSSNQPFYVEVEDDDEGDRVQVYIG